MLPQATGRSQSPTPDRRSEDARSVYTALHRFYGGSGGAAPGGGGDAYNDGFVHAARPMTKNWTRSMGCSLAGNLEAVSLVRRRSYRGSVPG